MQPPLPQDLLDALEKAEADRLATVPLDSALRDAGNAVTTAQQQQADATAVALDAHRTALASGTAALEAVRRQFGLPSGNAQAPAPAPQAPAAASPDQAAAEPDQAAAAPPKRTFTPGRR